MKAPGNGQPGWLALLLNSIYVIHTRNPMAKQREGESREEESFDRLAEGDGSTVSPNQAQIDLDENENQSSKEELVEKETRKVKENEKYVGG